MKKITKKEVVKILRTCNRTTIFKLVANLYDKTPSKSEVYHYVKDNAPSKRVANAAFEIAYNGNVEKQLRFGHEFISDQNRKSFEFRKQNIIHDIVRFAVREVKKEENAYTKVPMAFGYTDESGKWHTKKFIFCSKIHGSKDYNKLDVDYLDEKLISLLISYVKKYINY